MCNKFYFLFVNHKLESYFWKKISTFFKEAVEPHK